MMSLTWIIYTLIGVELIHSVLGRVTFEVLLEKFETHGKLADGSNCDLWPTAACDTYFKICLDAVPDDRNHDSCDYKYIGRTSIYSETNTVEFGTDGFDNPIITQLTTWPGSFVLSAYAADEDPWNPDDFLDEIFYTFSGTPDESAVLASWTPVKADGERASDTTELYFSVRVYCDSSYYGPNCDVYCHSTQGIPGHCTCYGQVCLDACTQITNCEKHECTTSTEERCVTCKYEYSPVIRAYRPKAVETNADGECEKLCSWRGDSQQCYPGKCADDTPTSCQCAPEFGGTDCQSITNTPDMLYCLASVLDSAEETAEVNCETQSGPTKYTNIVAQKLKVEWKTQYKGPEGTGPSGSTYPYPFYVADFDVGVVSDEVDWTIFNGYSVISSGSILCNTGISADAPDKGLHDCDEAGLLSTPLLSGNILVFITKSTNGGRLQINNYDNSGVSPIVENLYYSGMTLTHTASFTFDFDPPKHCSVVSSCGLSMLERGKPFTKEATFSITWDGWEDDVSGVSKYTFEVYKFKPLGDGKDALLDYNTEPPIVSETVDSLLSPAPNITLTESGEYCVVLIVFDATSGHESNHRLARRFLLYDDSSQVDISNHSDHNLFVTSAAAATSYEWITSLDEPVTIQWVGHFFNEFHRTNKLLNGIAAHSVPIEAAYEERTGQPHGGRSMEAIPNVNGIIRFDIMSAIDTQGGRTLTAPGFVWMTVTEFQSEEETMSITRMDGDSIRVWVKAFDVMNNTRIDDVLVHVDSSEPYITNVGLVRDGEKFLMVHSTTDLFDLILEFDTYDYHSGMKQITWELLDMANNIVHGTGAVAVVRTNAQDLNCVAPACYCIQREEQCFMRTYQIELDSNKMDIPHGNHDFDYMFVITAVNNAMLQTIYRFQLAIDASAPLPGHVFDAELGQEDSDYQSSLRIHGSWHGFFDRESGIMYYKYAIHTDCLSDADFEHGGIPPTEILVTLNTYAFKTVGFVGNYYTTVVAYNHAFEPSHPVCSDGITVDTTPPVVGSIHVKNAFIKPGLVSDGNNMMYMDEGGYVYNLEVQTPDCSATIIDGLLLYESRTFPEPNRPSQTNCSYYNSAGERHYLATENMFDMTWEGSDMESTIHDYEIALSSTVNSIGDIMPYTSSHGHTHFITFHPNLVNFQEFYVLVKATNKAGLQTTEIQGPFQVRINGPSFYGEITLAYEMRNTEFLIGSFKDSAYDHDDINLSYLKYVEYSLGERSCSGDILSWSRIDNSDKRFDCSNTWPQTCVVIDTDANGFDLHHNTDYCLSVRLQGVNKLTTSTNAWYRHTVNPVAGMLWEVDSSDTELVKTDIDYQTSTSNLHLKFISHESQRMKSLKYEVGVGTKPGQDNTKAFTSVNITENINIQNLILDPNTKYFSTTKILDTDSEKTSFVQSDGVLVLSQDMELLNFVVYDGIACTEDKQEDGRMLAHHVDPTDVPSCGVDIDYQVYTTVMSAYWNYSSEDSYLQYFLISVEKKQDDENGAWKTIISEYFIGKKLSISLTGLHLEAGETYRIVLQGCHPVGCYRPKTTDGVTILPAEPIAQQIHDIQYNETDAALTVTWNPFTDPYHGVDFNVISQYALALFVRPENSEDVNQITKWVHLSDGDYNIEPITGMMNFTYNLEGKLEASSCLSLAVRGYNKAMLYATTYKEFMGCTVLDKYPLQIFDAVGEALGDGTMGDISVSGNEVWLHQDAEYTKSKTSLSAVWPSLRYGYMKWIVVHGDNVNRLAYKSDLKHLDYWSFDCSLPEVLACGSTNDKFLNVHDLVLEEGFRYHICIYSNTTTITQEKWDDVLPEISVCTNGITVDTQPPIGGLVWIGNRQEHSHFQSQNLVLVVHWNSFIDVEVHQRTSHDSGIRNYQLAIGSAKNNNDVLDFMDVGITNIQIIAGLSLTNGRTYYVTIKAQDYIGLETSKTSEGVMVDITPPNAHKDRLIMSGHYLTAESSIMITFSNGAFNDPESGISDYTWCIGSKENLCDTIPRTMTEETILSITSDITTFIDGQEYFVILEAYNGAGLSVSTTVTTFIVDVTPPDAGFVYEVGTDLSIDMDYQVSSNALNLVWGDFNDVESHILEYRLTIGSCKTCSDILNDVYVGLVEVYQINHLELRPGTKYFTRVKACNSAGLCTTVLSDGVTVDGTPPHLGHVYDGLFDGDRDYQPTNNVVHAHLENVHDTQSGLAGITWWAGTSTGGTELFLEEMAYSHTVLEKQLNKALTEGTTIYVTVKVCNKAGQCIQKSSDGSMVDTTAPVITGTIELIPTVGTVLANYQIYRNTMALQWMANEDLSPIITTYISLLSHDDTHLILPTVKLIGNPQSHILDDLQLRDGDVYVVKITICNAASLCSESMSEEILIDSSPPTSGAFAVDTEHVIELSRQREDWMIYDNAHTDGPLVKLAWVGFQDPHSDVLKYNIKIGTEFHTYDMAELAIAHQSNDSHRDEGFVVTENIIISRPLSSNEQVYITLYAINTAGLQSSILHGLFNAIPSGGDTGILELVRRCFVVSCTGHCTCPPHGDHTCIITGAAAGCTDKTGDASYAAVTVYDIIPRTESDELADIDYIPTVHILNAEWTVAENASISPKWFDWSVGIKDQTPGSGLLDINTQPIWYEAGNAVNAVFSMANSELTDEMSAHVTYVFYVRAWYDENVYTVFKSDGVQVDGTAPELSRSYSVVEVSDLSYSSDIDFTASTSTIAIKWNNVFRDDQSDFDHFDVIMYSSKMVTVIASEQVYDREEISLTGLSLIQGEHYFTKIVACNKAGLCTEATSDGFLVDTTPPSTGLVLDGRNFYDIDYSQHTQQASVSWQGFYDDDSFVHHFVLCAYVGSTEVSCQNAGRHQRKKVSLPEHIANGEIISFTVYAINGANLSSPGIRSDGFILDYSPPSDKHHFRFANNTVVNGNFEYNTDYWEIQAEQSMESDNKLCILNGFLKQEIQTVENQKYRLQFDVNGFNSTLRVSIGYVQFGKNENHFVYASSVDDALHLRQKLYFVMAHSSISLVQFGTMTDIMICISNIRLESIEEGTRNTENSEHPEASFNSSVHVHVIASSMGITLVLNWDFEDLETPLVNHMFAVGTVKGGNQLKEFTSTGIKQTAAVSGLKVPQGTILYVTVVATNAVGLSSVVHADPVIVDVTPPVIELFQVNNGSMLLSSLLLDVNWEAVDLESGIEKCDFTIGSDNSGITAFTSLSLSASGRETVFLEYLNNSDIITCKIRCKSFRDMYTEQIQGPITYVTKSPNIKNANVVIVPYSETFYSNKDHYLSSATSVWFRWDGIFDPIGIQSCEIMVTDGEGDILKVTSLGVSQHRIAVLENGDFEQGIPYLLKVTCFNHAGYASDPVTTEFHIDSTVPSYTGEPLGVFWKSDTKVQLNWSGLFTAATPLVYELNLGTTPGGIDVLSWLETTVTDIEVTNLNKLVTHHLSLSAISQSGLYVTRTFVVTY